MRRTSISNTVEKSKTRCHSFKYLVEKRRLSVVSTYSTSETDTEPVIIEPDIETVLELSCSQSSTCTSRQNSLSGVYDSWFSNDMNKTMSNILSEQTSSKKISEVTKVTNKQDKGRLKLVDDSFDLAVIGNGTRLMREIDFPTVIIETRKKNLQNSMVYYIVLKPTLGLYVGEIACLLFTNPHRSKRDTIKAELLPLISGIPSKRSGGSFTPLLLQEKYKGLFRKGSTFQVNAIEGGRPLDWKQRQWKNYDLESSWVSDLLSRLVWLDVQQIPKHMVKQLSPLRTVDEVKKMQTRRRRKSFVSLLNKRWAQVGTPELKLSLLHPNLKLKGLATSGGSTFADWFMAVPPYIQVDKDFTCDGNTKLRKDTFKSSCEYDEYLTISGTI